MSFTTRLPALKRVLGPLDGAALVISNVIGIGIFVTPGIVAQSIKVAGG